MKHSGKRMLIVVRCMLSCRASYGPQQTTHNKQRSTALLRCFVASWLILLCNQANAQLKQYDSPYYVIHTDLTGDDVKEASVRMTRMAEEYYNRTRDFSGQINSRLPFKLFKNRKDYIAAGAPAGSAGV